jgi:hypothetical protein
VRSDRQPEQKSDLAAAHFKVARNLRHLGRHAGDLSRLPDEAADIRAGADPAGHHIQRARPYTDQCAVGNGAMQAQVQILPWAKVKNGSGLGVPATNLGKPGSTGDLRRGELVTHLQMKLSGFSFRSHA